MKQCQQCEREFTAQVRFCPYDGLALEGNGSGQTGNPRSLIGEVLDGKFRLEAQLRQESFATVYGATQLLPGRPVSLKLIHLESDDDPRKQALRRQARQLAALRDRNVAEVIEIGIAEEQRVIYAAVEYTEGISLSRRLKEAGPLDELEALSLLKQISSAIEAINSVGLSSEGLSSNNIWIDYNDPLASHVKVDLVWLAPPRTRQRNKAEHTGELPGDPAYLSPEECRGEDPDDRSEVYRLGLIAYEMLVGRPPFRSDSIPRLILMQLNEAPPPIERSTPPGQVQQRFESVVMRALAKLPQYRHQLVSEFTRAIEEAEVALRPKVAPAIVTSTSLPAAGSDGHEERSVARRGRETQWLDVASELRASPVQVIADEAPFSPVGVVPPLAEQAKTGLHRDSYLTHAFPADVTDAEFVFAEPADEGLASEVRHIVGAEIGIAGEGACAVEPEHSDGVERAVPQEELLDLTTEPARQLLVESANSDELVAEQETGPEITLHSSLGEAYAPAVEPPQEPSREMAQAHLASAVIKPLYLDDSAQFTVYRPKVVQPNVWARMLAFAHLSRPRLNEGAPSPDPLQQVQRQASEALSEALDQYKTLVQHSSQAIPGRGEISFVPTTPGIEFDPPSRTFSWQETVHCEEFRLRASAKLDGQMTRGRLSIFVGGVLLAEAPLNIRVDSRVSQPEAVWERCSAQQYRKVFAAYSHYDEVAVERFGEFAEAFGDRFLNEVRVQQAAETWSAKLEKLILEADVFQLFWSSNSMFSQCVRQEWEYALSLRRPSFIRPTYWEEPLPESARHSLPPEELTRCHFQRIWFGVGASAQSSDAATQTTGALSSGPLPATNPSLPVVELTQPVQQFEFNETPARSAQPEAWVQAAHGQAPQRAVATSPPPLQPYEAAPNGISEPPPAPAAALPPSVPITAEHPAPLAAAPMPYPDNSARVQALLKTQGPSLSWLLFVALFLLVGGVLMLGLVYLLNR